MFSVTKPPISVSKKEVTYSTDLANTNVFRERFSSLTDDQWHALWLSTEHETHISGLEFPTVPPQDLQLQIHGSATWEVSMGEAFDFYRFIKSHLEINPTGTDRFLDYGCGWGRMTRPFMRHFNHDKLFGFEPHLLLATIARSLNPYFCVLGGGFRPDGSIPKNWFDLIVGWSIFSHLSRASFKEWLREMSDVLKPGGIGIFTTWGKRFLERLQAEKKLLDEGIDIHWYSKVCIEAAGDIAERIEQYERGDFVWFTESGSASYGEAFISELALRRVIDEDSLPLTIMMFDTSSLPQDVFLVRRV
jgi:SAM-dependent methyltransferase